MISAYLGKISMYLKIGLLLVIIILLVTIGIQWTRIKDVERKNENLKIENKKAWKEYDFAQERIKILSHFTNSSEVIDKITNEIIFESNKQNAIDSIIEDFYR
jgi:uncharacterized membrane-anchored protein YhcB (DUF1043 family)